MGYKWELERRQKSRALKERRKNEKKEQIVAERIGPLSAEDLEALKAEGDLLEIELNAFQPDEALKSEKQVLFDQGFKTWNRRDFKSFCLAMEKFGREDRDSVIQEVVAHLGKDENEVKRYFDTWMLRHSELSEDERHMNRIIKGEEKIQRRKDITNALDWKVNQYGKPWQELRLQFNTTKGKSFTEEEDRFLTCMMHKLGYGRWEELKLQIRKAWQFRFDWYIKSRTPLELQRRCDIIVRSIESEKDPEKRAAQLQKKQIVLKHNVQLKKQKMKQQQTMMKVEMTMLKWEMPTMQRMVNVVLLVKCRVHQQRNVEEKLKKRIREKKFCF